MPSQDTLKINFQKIKNQLDQLRNKPINLLIAIIAGMFVGIFLFIFAQFFIVSPLKAETIFIVEQGSSGQKIAQQLTQKNIISSPLFFRIFLKLSGKDGKIHAGEYAFKANESIGDIAGKMIQGEVFFRQITIIEGATVKQIRQQLQENQFLSGKITQSPEEGSLLPQTYNFIANTGRDEMLKRMGEAMAETLDSLWEQRDKDIFIKTKREAIILASIIERETGIASERGRVASVFYNRLINDWPLQTDPSLIYYASNRLGFLNRPIRQSDLRRKHPYNTYRNRGLPPTAIANPSKDALYATLHPKKTRYFFFVADGKGGHAFSRTLKEHNEHVKKWREIEKQRKKAAQ